MQRRGHFISSGLIFLAMILLWLAAHDLYVSRINQQQQNLVQSLKEGHHNLSWALKSQRDLVSGFGSGWRVQSQGLEVETDKAEISLAFDNHFIVPNHYQHLNFDWIEQDSMKHNTQIQLEFSQVALGVFYYSPAINLNPGHNSINLAELTWTARQGSKNKPINWQDLPLLNTLVWRFSSTGKGMNKAVLQNIKIPQTTTFKRLNQTAPLSDLLNNTLRQSWHSHRLSRELILNNPPVMQTYRKISPWVIFAVAVLLLIPATVISQRPADKQQQALTQRMGSLMLIMMVVLVAILMQTDFLGWVLARWPWLALVAFILPILLLIRRWIRPLRPAAPVWLLTMMTAFFMMYIGVNYWGFVSDLPLYVLWALAQQVILGPLVSDYLHKKGGLSAGFVALLCGVLFAMLHVPNQMLMLATFTGGLLWSYSWLKYRNIYANTFSHALLALLFYQIMPAELLGTARVGLWF